MNSLYCNLTQVRDFHYLHAAGIELAAPTWPGNDPRKFNDSFGQEGGTFEREDWTQVSTIVFLGAPGASFFAIDNKGWVQR